MLTSRGTPYPTVLTLESFVGPGQADLIFGGKGYNVINDLGLVDPFHPGVLVLHPPKLCITLGLAVNTSPVDLLKDRPVS